MKQALQEADGTKVDSEETPTLIANTTGDTADTDASVVRQLDSEIESKLEALEENIKLSAGGLTTMQLVSIQKKLNAVSQVVYDFISDKCMQA